MPKILIFSLALIIALPVFAQSFPNPESVENGIKTVSQKIEIAQNSALLEKAKAEIKDRPFDWYVVRASGILAYLSLFSIVVLGLLITTKLFSSFHPFLKNTLHCWISWIGLILVLTHIVLLPFHKFLSFSVLQLLVPFTSNYRPLYVGLGVISFYLIILIIFVTKYVKTMPRKYWKIIHKSSFLVFIFTTIHGFYSGTDSHFLLIKFMYLNCSLIVTFLTTWRILSSLESKLKLSS